MLRISVLAKVGGQLVIGHMHIGSEALWIRSAGLPPEVALAGIGDEKGADGTIRIVSAEIAMPPVEASEPAVGPSRFEDRTAGRHRCVSQLLRQPQILAL